MSVASELKQLVIEVLDVDDDKVTIDARFVDDLGADSLQLVELVMGIEERFGIEIPDEDAEQIDSLREAVKYIEAASSAQPPPEDEPASEAPSTVDPGALDPPDFEEPAPIPAQPASEEDDDHKTLYAVVVNAEKQYAIWPLDRETPAGWRDTGTHGTKSECLAHIQEMDDDVQPHPLRPTMPGG